MAAFLVRETPVAPLVSRFSLIVVHFPIHLSELSTLRRESRGYRRASP